jgi:23S rRNA (pseudouridine1915-N3)-methyltransferase
MKFNECNQAEWLSLQLYFDTCIIPITALSGRETPWQMKAALERLRDALDTVEIPFKGRTVTLPAVQYRMANNELFLQQVADIAGNCKASGFKYVIAISVADELVNLSFQNIDLLLVNPDKSNALKLVSELWQNQD